MTNATEKHRKREVVIIVSYAVVRAVFWWGFSILPFYVIFIVILTLPYIGVCFIIPLILGEAC